MDSQAFCGKFWDYNCHVKATHEFVKGFYDRAFGDKKDTDEFSSDWGLDNLEYVKLKEKLELILSVLDKWVNEGYTIADDYKRDEEIAEVYRLLGKVLPEMWD